ncbi:Nup133 N terminal like-domain-containing protein, partial [Limtongia smithiae]|uniref:Nup133 N terminal like-domain-containing protein n=1 Tax=Limtongia smithiae TaxID=1125753 RepID=UPI0034CDC557
MQSGNTAQRRSSRLQSRRNRTASGVSRTVSNSGESSTAVQLASSTVPAQNESQFALRAKGSAIEYTKNAKYCVLRLPAFPNILKTDESFSGCLDSSTDSALLLTETSVYIWRYTSPDYLPTTISFPLSSTSEGRYLGVLATPSAGSAEPGLVLVHPSTGQVQYWEAVGEALAEGLLHRKKGVEAVVGLYQGEVLEFIGNLEPLGVIVATSSGRLILIALHDTSGRPDISCTVMRGSGTGIWSNLKGALRVGATRRDIVSIKPGKLLGRGERTAVTVNVRGAVTIWQCSRSGHYSLQFEMDLRDLLIQSINGVYPQAEKTFKVHDIEMLPQSSNEGIILASFIYDLESSEHVYYILFTVHLEQEDFRVISAHRITQYLKKSTRKPRIFLPKPGYTAFIVLSHAVIMVDTILQQQRQSQLEPAGYKWEDVVEFKSTVDIFSAASEDITYDNGETGRHAGVVVVSSATGVVRIERFEDELNSTVMSSNMEIIMSKLEQAVYYGTIDENPVDFERSEDARHDIRDIEDAIARVSSNILSGTSTYSWEVDDTLETLTMRCKALQRLAEHLVHIFPYLSHECRLTLLTKLEKCEAAKNVYRLFYASNANSSDTIEDAVAEISHRTQNANQWFCDHILDIGDLVIEFSNKSLLKANNTPGDRQSVAQHIKEADETLITVLSMSAYSIRQHFKAKIFSLDDNRWGNVMPWTSTWEVLSCLEKQYAVTKAMCFRLWEASDLGDPEIEMELRAMLEYLSSLAECLCIAYEEQIGYCEESNTLAQEAEQFRSTYLEERGSWIKPLLFFGHREKAYEIAENHHDFNTLAELCRQESMDLRKLKNADSQYSQDELVARISHYFDTYEYDFASVLYQYYINSGHVDEIFIAFPQYKSYLEQFLSSGEYDRLAWIHDVQTANFVEAGNKLDNVAQHQEDSLANKKLQLSIAKLCYISGQLSGQDMMQRIGAVNDELHAIDELQIDAVSNVDAMD